ncbi:succinate--CoA ligase [GDP-forming] subunit beta, mitochondrial-like [Oppia nitens]|uniref:succinate--CoA ligase [GDP-forming] subunit beta, mitochondrial-like n=1 Tax=Oppia nitens TaxID=1686743 RepID=UPI0023DC8A94|nr:succinate--CoA ligase [GDP-forming] subunit beta, mitochondrial-like [Oppia nitens]
MALKLKHLLPINTFLRRSVPVVNSCYQQKRCLNLQEYQSKQLMRNNGVRVQRFCVVESVDEIKSIIGNYTECPSADSSKSSSEQFSDLSLAEVEEYVIKAQVLAGGRGKGYFKNSSMKGGVQLTKDKSKVSEICGKMLNDYLITAQTTKSGVLVHKVMIAEALDIKKELYLAILLDRASNGPVIVVSQEGGVDIEQVAEKNPDAIHKFIVPIDTNSDNLDLELAKNVAKNGLGLTGHLADDAAEQISRLYKLFLNLDALQVEINPFGISTKDKLVCFDAKINFDENAIFRQQWMKQIEKDNASEEDPRDQLAREYNLNFVPMDGNIACLVNGAGLAMATMDIIHHYGGNPANFLDVGGSVNQEGVENAFRLITADQKVKAILVNIFGGIVNCEIIAKGLIAAKNLVKVPLIVRLEGTNAETARALLSDVSDIISAADLDDAAQKAVNSVKI